MSGDTEPSDNLVKFSQGVDVLVHEVGSRLRNDPQFEAPPDEVLPNGLTRRQARDITVHHTDPTEAGQIVARVKPKLTVFSHGGAAAALPYVRQNYAGPVESGDDLMTIEVGATFDIRRFNP